MTRSDIERVQMDYVKAAVRAKRAGFDAVEVVVAGYLDRPVPVAKRPTSVTTNMAVRLRTACDSAVRLCA